MAWGSTQFVKQHIHEVWASSAPEICIEIVSPSNSQAEGDQKIALFLEVGAIEVWLLDNQGDIIFFNAEGRQQKTAFNVEIGQLI